MLSAFVVFVLNDFDVLAVQRCPVPSCGVRSRPLCWADGCHLVDMREVECVLLALGDVDDFSVPDVLDLEQAGISGVSALAEALIGCARYPATTVVEVTDSAWCVEKVFRREIQRGHHVFGVASSVAVNQNRAGYFGYGQRSIAVAVMCGAFCPGAVAVAADCVSVGF